LAKIGPVDPEMCSKFYFKKKKLTQAGMPRGLNNRYTKSFFFLLDKLSARGWRFNGILQMSVRSWDFVQNILLKAYCAANENCKRCSMTLRVC